MPQCPNRSQNSNLLKFHSVPGQHQTCRHRRRKHSIHRANKRMDRRKMFARNARVQSRLVASTRVSWRNPFGTVDSVFPGPYCRPDIIDVNEIILAQIIMPPHWGSEYAFHFRRTAPSSCQSICFPNGSVTDRPKWARFDLERISSEPCLRNSSFSYEFVLVGGLLWLRWSSFHQRRHCRARRRRRRQSYRVVSEKQWKLAKLVWHVRWMMVLSFPPRLIMVAGIY